MHQTNVDSDLYQDLDEYKHGQAQKAKMVSWLLERIIGKTKQEVTVISLSQPFSLDFIPEEVCCLVKE